LILNRKAQKTGKKEVILIEILGIFSGKLTTYKKQRSTTNVPLGLKKGLKLHDNIRKL